jgi:hypothetical protein
LADPDKIPILDIYYTLETDQPVMIEQQKLKVCTRLIKIKELKLIPLHFQEYEAQEALNEEEEEKENAQDHSVTPVNQQCQ